jgi:AcrR family transcriptional regulator
MLTGLDKRPETQSQIDRVLDAAEAVVVRSGIGALTLDAVAAEAGMSKGGLLHHFASKDRLIEGMVARCARGWRECAMGTYEATEPGPGRMARALLTHLSDEQGWTEQCQQSSCAVFAALVQNPRLIEPMRAVYGELREKLAQDGLAPGVGETVIAAMDGLWLYRVLGLAEVDRSLMDRIRRVLEPLVGVVGEGSGGVGGGAVMSVNAGGAGRGGAGGTA